MTEKKNNEAPKWFVYDTEGDFDVQGTLKAVPEKLDKSGVFFREVPEWFEAGADGLDELREGLSGIGNMPEEERAKYTPEEIENMKKAFQKLISYNELMADPGLSGNQKEVLRCICYWFSLDVMNSIPLTPEEEEALF